LGHGISTSDHRLTWTTGLELSAGQNKVEIDFAVWYQRDSLFRLSTHPVLIIGEAKSFAHHAITREVIDDLKRVAGRFPGAFMAVAVLKSDFSPQEREGLTSLAKWGRRRSHEGWPMHPLIVMTGTELLANWYVKQAWKDKGGKTKALVEPAYVDTSDIYTFAELTQQLYLDLPPFSSDHRKKLRSRTSKSQLEAKKESGDTPGLHPGDNETRG
jgi:hypothetical protein